MGRSLTLNVPDEVFHSLDSQARAAGVSIQDWTIEILSSRLMHESKSGNGDDDAHDGLARLVDACGKIAVGDPNGAENEAIDRDLAQEYESPHEL
jgi:hypothetical protein